MQGAEVFYSLGSLLHNDNEMERLRDKGLEDVDDLGDLEDVGENEDRRLKKRVLVRAHGEPPETFERAKSLGVELIDATCGVVKRLQDKIKAAQIEMTKRNGQVVIFGKPWHPEIIGLLGQTDGKGILITSMQELGKIDMSRPVQLFSQTTMDGKTYWMISDAIKQQMLKMGNKDFEQHDSICRHVTNRIPALQQFAEESEVIIFVSGRESSNGKKLFKVSKEVNARTHFISGMDELDPEWIKEASSVGISGSASTPLWLMEEVAEKLKSIS